MPIDISNLLLDTDIFYDNGCSLIISFNANYIKQKSLINGDTFFDAFETGYYVKKSVEIF